MGLSRGFVIHRAKIGARQDNLDLALADADDKPVVQDYPCWQSEEQGRMLLHSTRVRIGCSRPRLRSAAFSFGSGTLCLIGGCLAAPPQCLPISPKLRVGSALVTSVRRSPVRRRGFFFLRETRQTHLEPRSRCAPKLELGTRDRQLRCHSCPR